MVIKVYVAMISCSQEIKKNQQRAVMILESKNVPYTIIDITDPASEDSKDYMVETATPKEGSKIPVTPQIYNEADYCGDYDGLDMANECDTLGDFLKLSDEEKKAIKIGITGIIPTDKSEEIENSGITNGVSASREVSPEKIAMDQETNEAEANEVQPAEVSPEKIAIDQETNEAEANEVQPAESLTKTEEEQTSPADTDGVEAEAGDPNESALEDAPAVNDDVLDQEGSKEEEVREVEEAKEEEVVEAQAKTEEENEELGAEAEASEEREEPKAEDQGSTEADNEEEGEA